MACQSVQGVTPRRGEMLMVCAFFICSLAQLGVKPLDRFWRVISQNVCFCDYCIPLCVRTTISQFRWVKIPQNIQKFARIGIFQPKCQNLITAISPKQLSPIMFGIDGIAHRWFHTPRGGLGTPLLPETIPEIDADPASFFGGGGSSQRSSLAKNVSFAVLPRSLACWSGTYVEADETLMGTLNKRTGWDDFWCRSWSPSWFHLWQRDV